MIGFIYIQACRLQNILTIPHSFITLDDLFELIRKIPEGFPKLLLNHKLSPLNTGADRGDRGKMIHGAK